MLRLYPLAVSLKGARARNADRQVSTRALEQQRKGRWLLSCVDLFYYFSYHSVQQFFCANLRVSLSLLYPDTECVCCVWFALEFLSSRRKPFASETVKGLSTFLFVVFCLPIPLPSLCVTFQPFPTMYWLSCPSLKAAVSQLENQGLILEWERRLQVL